MSLSVIISTTPDRTDGLKQVLQSLEKQTFTRETNVLLIYDGFSEEWPDIEVNGVSSLRDARPDYKVFELLRRHKKGTLARLMPAITVRPSWWNNNTTAVAVMDDDLIFPEDYLEEGYREITSAHPSVGAIAWHGKFHPADETGCRFLENRIRYGYDDHVKSPQKVTVPGVGVSFIRTPLYTFATWLKSKLVDDTMTHSCDIFIGYAAERYGMDIIVPPHGKEWIRTYKDYPVANWKQFGHLQDNAFDRAFNKNDLVPSEVLGCCIGGKLE